MNIAHVGPPLARRGGSSGYLWQLAAASEGTASGHAVSFPPREAGQTAPPPRASRLAGIRRVARRALLGPPTFYRPSYDELTRERGAIETLLRESAQVSCLEAAASIDAARAAAPDVFFAHDPAVAEKLLSVRQRGQQVWLMIHSPMPIALYLAWAFGVPEWEWPALAALPDTRRWIDWELDIWSSVDRLISPCREGIAELARVDARFAGFRSIDFVLTGARAPARAFAGEAPDVLRRRWRLPSDEPVGLFLGSAQPYRGLDALVASVEALPAGPGVIAIAGPARESVRRHRRLQWLGPVREVADLVAAVDFVVNVNRFSLFDLSTIEGAEAARPFLFHATGGNLHFAALGVGCRLVSNLQPETVARGLAEFFTMDADERRRLGARSRATYERELMPAHMWSRHAALYDRAASTTLAQTT
jgi:hypothetical protein